MNLARPTVGLGDRGVHDFEHDGRDIEPGAVSLDVRDDRVVGNMQRKIRINRDLGTIRGDLDMFVHAFSSRDF